MLQADFISFFVKMKCQKVRKVDESSSYRQRNSSYPLNDFSNLNEIFRKDVTYDNIKSKKQGFTLSLADIFF